MKNNALIASPAWFFTLVFVMGIASANSWITGHPGFWLTGSAVLSVFSGICQFRNLRQSAGVLILTAAFCLGAGVFNFANGTIEETHIAHLPPSEETAVIGMISKDMEKSENGLRLELKVMGIETGPTRSVSRTGKIKLYITDDEMPEDLTAQLTYGTIVRVETELRVPEDFRNPGISSQALRLAYKGIYLTGTLRFHEFMNIVSKPDPWNPLIIIHRLRVFLLKIIAERTGVWGETLFLGMGVNTDQMKPLAQALLLGDRPGMDESLELDYKNSGLYHLIAISGGHMVLIAAVFHFVLRKLGFGYRWKNMINAGILILYGFLAGGGPTVNRAVFIIVLVLIGKTLDREIELLNLLGLTAFILLMINPCDLFDVSFQLTYAATLGIVFFTDEFNDMLRWIPWKPIQSGIAVSMAAQLGTAPLTACHFDMIGGWSFLPYLPVIPLMTGALVSGIAGLVLSPIVTASEFCFHFHGTILAVMTKMAQIYATWPGVVFKITTPGWIEMLLFLAGLVILALKFNKVVQRRMLAAVMILVAISWHQWGRQIFNDRLLAVHFVDVGNADCTIIKTPSRETLLVDGGGSFESTYDIGRNVVVPVLRHLGINRIDYAVVTHPHPDHQKGMISVIREMDVRRLWIADESIDDLDQKTLVETANKQGCPVISMDVQEIFKFLPVSINNRSIVIQLRYGRFSLLLPGDAEREAEAGLARYGRQLESVVLKAPHHGSRTSSTSEFLRQVRPKLIFIPSGRQNRFGHPHPSTLNRIRITCPGTDVYRADIHGMLTIRTNGEWMETETY